MAQLDVVLSQFHSDLQRTGDLLRLIKEFRKFAGSVVPVPVTDGSVPWSEALGLADAAPRVRTDLPILSGSLLLYICGRFEYFVREVVISLADEIAAKVSSYAELSDRVRIELQARSLDVAQNPGRFGYTKLEAEQLLISLGQNLDGSASAAPLEISSHVLSITESNMNSRMVADIFKRVDIEGFWSDVGKQAPLKTHLSTSGDRECTKEATSRLDAMMKERNAIAHPTGTISFPDPDQVIDSSTFLRCLSQVIVDVARVPRA